MSKSNPIPDEIIKELNECGDSIVNAPMKEYTTFKAGGPADLLIRPEGKSSLTKILKICKGGNISITVIGGGSNLLVGDKGIRGVVVMLSADEISQDGIYPQNDGTVYSCASMSKKAFINFAISNGYSGFEFMAGIPGCMGGGIFMNAGTFMGNFVDILSRVVIFNSNGKEKIIPVTKEMSSYRKMGLEPGSIIAGAYFTLPKADDTESVREKIRMILEDRAAKHPLDFPSAGSVFKNPQGHSSWKLIDDAGLKGKQIGGAAVSDLHTNFIINRGGAAAADIKNLIEFIQETVLKKFGVSLETEIKMLGEF